MSCCEWSVWLSPKPGAKVPIPIVASFVPHSNDLRPVKLPDHWFFATLKKGVYTLSPDETRHATKVLRLGKGDQLQWTDGLGNLHVGTISLSDRQGAQLQVISTTNHERPPERHLAVGQLHDATRLEWLIEKGTELGVMRFSLLATARTERTRHKLRRLEAKALSAIKQSQRTWLPQIEEISFAEALNFPQIEQQFIAHCHKPAPQLRLPSSPTKPWRLYIGPEGDFTAAEVSEALAAGCQPVTLGDARLRTETAAIAAVVMLQ